MYTFFNNCFTLPLVLLKANSIDIFSLETKVSKYIAYILFVIGYYGMRQ